MSGGKISLPDDGNLNDGPLPLLAFLISPVHAPQNGKAKGTHRRCGQAPPAHGQTEATTAKKRCGHGATSLVGRLRLRRAELSSGSAHCSRSVAASMHSRARRHSTSRRPRSSERSASSAARSARLRYSFALIMLLFGCYRARKTNDRQFVGFHSLQCDIFAAFRAISRAWVTAITAL